MEQVADKLVRFVAVLAAAVTSGTTSATEQLGAIPEAVIVSLVEQEQVEHWQPDHRRRLMQLLSRDERVAIRTSAARGIALCPLPLTDTDLDWLGALAADPSPPIADAFVSGLRTLLERAQPIERTYLVTSWALSPVEAIRLAIARALDPPLAALGAHTAVEHLLGDPCPAVRDAAAHAAQRRAAVT